MRKFHRFRVQTPCIFLYLDRQFSVIFSRFFMERFVLVVLISLCSFTSAQEYVITRQIAVLDRHGTSHEQPDLVQIPSSLCRDNGTTECPLMEGQRHSICQCACDKTDTFHNYFKSTFGFYNKTWKCEENIAVRRHSGCLLSLIYEYNGNEPVLTIPYDSYIDYTVVNATTGKYVYVSEGKTCSLRAERSTYMKCNGEWEPLDSTLVTERFGIQVNNNHINFGVVTSASSSYPLPSGRIIRLAVTCSDRPWESSQCFVVKVEGELKCPVSPSPPASRSPFHLLSSSEHSGTSTPVHVTSVPNANRSKDSSKGRKAFSTGLVIGVTLSGVAVLVALSVLVVFMIRLRKRRFDNQKRKASNSALIENKTHGEVAGGAEKPTHRVGEYADPKGLGSSVDKLPMREEPLYHVPGCIIDDNTAQDEPVYDVLEELPPHGTLKNEALQSDKDPPVYGTFNEPSKKSTSDAPRRGYGNVLYDSVGDQ